MPKAAPNHRHIKANLRRKEGIIAVASGAIGCGLAEATSGIAWDPDPRRTGSHTMNYGWPFPVSRLVESINQSGSRTYHFYYPQGLPINAFIYGAVAFAGLNAVVIGVPFGVHKLREARALFFILELHVQRLH